MPRPKDTLDRISFPTPCEADWDLMTGNNQVRFCHHCNLNVHNLSAMTRQEAVRLVANSSGRLCARYIRRPDGEIHTSDVSHHQLYSIHRRASRLAAGAFTAALSLSSGALNGIAARTDSSATNNPRTAVVLRRSTSKVTGTGNASLTGVVKDPNGAVIQGATVSLTEESSGLERTTTTDEEGVFLLQALDEGSYTLKIYAAGFDTKQISNFNLRAYEEQRRDETLEVAGAFGGAVVIVEPSDPLVAAVLRNDLAEVRKLLATGADVNVLDKEYDLTALAQAVATGNREITQILLNAGADVNARNSRGQTALMWVNSETTSDIVWDLIDAGAKVDLLDDTKTSALVHAADYGNSGALQVLIDAGASIDAGDEDGRTALMVAAEMGNAGNVAALLKAGATVNMRDTEGTTALGLAKANDCEEVVKILEGYGGTE